MSWRHQAGSVLCLVCLMGCVSQQSNPAQSKPPQTGESVVTQWVLPEHVEKWLNEQEYGLVLEWLNTLPQNEPGFEAVAQIHREVVKMAKNYEHGVLEEINKEQRKGNMDGVFLILNTALRKLPDSKILQKNRKKLFSKQVRQIAFLNRQLLLARGNYLIRESRVREELAQIDWDNPAARWNNQRIREELKTTSFELIQCARQSWREGFSEQAQSCINLAGHMHKSKEQAMLAGQINGQIVKAEQVKKAKAVKRQQETIKVSAAELQDLAKRALSQGQLRAALDIIDELLHIDKQNKQVIELKKAVQAKLESRIAALMKRGNNYYKNGSIEDAKRDWEEVLMLDPNNKEARNNVQRALRVLEKLHELQGEENS